MSVLLGCIADDSTGASDLANTLVRGGMRTVMTIGIPAFAVPADAEAVVIALKSRTIPAVDAVAQSLDALKTLQQAGARQFLFKYCSTFDSTDAGNIGPVTDALLTALGDDFTIACPAFPEAGRTIFRGHLFVGDALLSESGMEKHPLTPMTDANLLRVLQRQTSRRVGLVRYDTVRRGADAVQAAFATQRQDGRAVAIVDAISDEDLLTIGAACRDLKLITGGSGVALGLPENYRRQGLLRFATNAAELPSVSGGAAIVSGSCSRATNAQVEHWRRDGDAFRVDPLMLADGADVTGEAVAWAKQAKGPVLIYATAEPEAVAAVQAKLGVQRAGALVEEALATISRELVRGGVRKLVVAGGETSGAVVRALGIRALRIGPQIDPGVPWTVSVGSDIEVALALKSGNFGTPDFFRKALRQWPEPKTRVRA
jgi:3-dehydrotetronate 4-kinase